MKLVLPAHLEHMRPQLEKLADAGGPEAKLVLDSLGIATAPPPRPKVYAVKRKDGIIVVSADKAYAKALAKGLPP